ncbi:MAG: hypothetical protein O3B24_04150 [Verrucomicrobia bacterium]|nr:hypothetical protein [Verrucomicrobiota bacterium]
MTHSVAQRGLRGIVITGWVALAASVLLPLLVPSVRAHYAAFADRLTGGAGGSMLAGLALLTVVTWVAHLQWPALRSVTACLLLSIFLHTLLMLLLGWLRLPMVEQSSDAVESRHEVMSGLSSRLEGDTRALLRQDAVALRDADTRALLERQQAQRIKEVEARVAVDKPAAPAGQATPQAVVELASASAPAANVAAALAEAKEAPRPDVTKPALARAQELDLPTEKAAEAPEARAVDAPTKQAGAVTVATPDTPQPKATSAPAPAPHRDAPAEARPRVAEVKPAITEATPTATVKAEAGSVPVENRQALLATVAETEPSAKAAPAPMTPDKIAGSAPVAEPSAKMGVAAPATGAGPTPRQTVQAAAPVGATAALQVHDAVGGAAAPQAGAQAEPLRLATPAASVAVAEGDAPAMGGPEAGVALAAERMASDARVVEGAPTGGPQAPLVAATATATGSLAADQAVPLLEASRAQGTVGANISRAAGSGSPATDARVRVATQAGAVATAEAGEKSGDAPNMVRAGAALTVTATQGARAVDAPDTLPRTPGGSGMPAVTVRGSAARFDDEFPAPPSAMRGAADVSDALATGAAGVRVSHGVEAVAGGEAAAVRVEEGAEQPGRMPTGAGNALVVARSDQEGAAEMRATHATMRPAAPIQGHGDMQPARSVVGGEVDGATGVRPDAQVATPELRVVAARDWSHDEMVPLAFSPGVDARGELVYAAEPTPGTGPATGPAIAVTKVSGAGAAADAGSMPTSATVPALAVKAEAARRLPSVVGGGADVRATAHARVQIADALPSSTRKKMYRDVAAAEMRASPQLSRQKLIYSLRSPEKRREMIQELGGSAETEGAVERALTWLAKAQSADGRWDVDGFATVEACGGAGDRTDGDVGVTGLALLAYLGAGYTHNRGDHQETIRKGLDWLVAGQAPDGDLRQGGQLYVQAMATAALCESYSLSGDARLKEPAQRAVQFVLAAQNPEAGWRYHPREDSDTSVTGWQVLALKSAEIAGIHVPPQHYAWTAQWLDKVRRGKEGGLYAYKEGHGPTPVMTAEGWFCQLFMGQDARARGESESARYLMANLPEWNLAQRGVIHFYYWYYATLALHLSGTQDFDTWNVALRETLLAGQRQGGAADGSWDPVDQLGERGGRMYATTMATLCLEVYYRYLPFYRIGER